MNIYRIKIILSAIIICIFLSGCTKGAKDMKTDDNKIMPVKGQIAFTSDRGGCLFLLKNGKKIFGIILIVWLIIKNL